MNSKIFSIARLTIGDKNFILSDFDPIEEKYNDYLEQNEKNRVIKKSVFNNKFVSLSFEEGHVKPRPEKVYNKKTQTEENNPRSVDQIERNTQSFFLIDIEDQKIFISDFKKKKMLEKWLSEKLNKQVLIRDIIDKGDFLNKIQNINTIYLSAVPTLFNKEGILGQELTKDHHNYGLGIKHIGVKITFEETLLSEKLKNKIPEKLKNKLQNLFNYKDNNELDKLEISGRYDDKFERVFNAEGIIDKIEIPISPNKNGLLDSKKVFQSLIKKIVR